MFVGLVASLNIGIFVSSVFLHLISLKFLDSIFDMFAGIFICFIICVLGSSFYLIKISKKLQPTDKFKFESEKEKFWSLLALFPIMMITWLVEFFMRDDHLTLYDRPSMISDLIYLFTALNIFVFFVLRKNVKMFISNKYRIFQRSVSSQSA